MKRNFWIFFSVLLVLLVLFGLVLIDKPQKELKDVTTELTWLHQAQFAGNYVAKEKGFYEEEGLNVSFVEFSFEEPPIDSVVSGKVKFGIVAADELILARAKGLPVRAFAVIYKVNPVCAYSLKEKGITKPQDFVGKRVGLQRGTNVEYLYLTMMGILDIDRSQVEEIGIGYGAEELLNGTVDVATGYIIDEPNIPIEKGYEVNTILMADYGTNIYADVLFATEETIRNEPDLVEGFLRATLDGWAYALQYEEEAVDITMNYVNDSQSHQRYILHSSLPLIHTGETPLGWMEEDKWGQAEEILFSQNILDKRVNIDEVYTNEFLEKIYYG